MLPVCRPLPQVLSGQVSLDVDASYSASHPWSSSFIKDEAKRLERHMLSLRAQINPRGTQITHGKA